MTTHSSLLSWKIPWSEEPGGLESMGSQSWTRVTGQDDDIFLSDTATLRLVLWASDG